MFRPHKSRDPSKVEFDLFLTPESNFQFIINTEQSDDEFNSRVNQ